MAPKATRLYRFVLNYNDTEPDHPWMADAIEADGIPAKTGDFAIHGHGETPTAAVKECCKYAAQDGWIVPLFEK